MRIEKFDKLESTSTYLKNRKNIKEWDVVVAKEQSGGRGRRGNSWSSPLGGAWFSFAIEKTKWISMEDYKKLSLIVGCSVMETFDDYDFNCSFKWTNDIFCGDKKIAGILVEKVGDFFIIGIGVNINNREFGEYNDIATSMINEIGAERNIDNFIRKVVNIVRINYWRLLRGEWKETLAVINSRNYLKGKKIVVDAYGELKEGVAGDIDESGRLCIIIGESVEYLDIGEVSVKREGDIR